MTGRRVSFYWRFCWSILSPVFMLIVFVYSFCSMEPLQYGQQKYPPEYIVAGWSLFGIAAMLTPLWCIFIMSYKSKSEGIFGCFRPSNCWGPRNDAIRSEWLKFREKAKQRKEQMVLAGNHSWLKQKWFVLCGKYE